MNKKRIIIVSSIAMALIIVLVLVKGKKKKEVSIPDEQIAEAWENEVQEWKTKISYWSMNNLLGWKKEVWEGKVESERYSTAAYQAYNVGKYKMELAKYCWKVDFPAKGRPTLKKLNAFECAIK